MGKIGEREAVDSLLRMLGKFLKSSGKGREGLAKDLDDFATWDLLEYNDGYEEFSEGLKEAMDPLFLFHKWKGNGIRYGKELFFGLRETKQVVERLKKLKREL